MLTVWLIVVIVLWAAAVLGVVMLVRRVRRLPHHKPLETERGAYADPLPVSTAEADSAGRREGERAA